MNSTILVATHLSCLFPSSPSAAIQIDTTRKDATVPSLSLDSRSPLEHASYSHIFNSERTGSVLLRVLQDRLTLELIALAGDLPPLRFLFPSLVLPSPSIFLYDDTIHVIVITGTGLLYRLVLPLQDGLLPERERLGQNWCREYAIRNAGIGPSSHAICHGPELLAITLINGDIMRLDCKGTGGSSDGGQWEEMIFHQTSFLQNLKAFIPLISAAQATRSQVISITCLPQPSDVEHFWTLSRDRTLRLWHSKYGCTSARILPQTLHDRAATPDPDAVQLPSQKHESLLEIGPRRLLRVFTINEDNVIVLAFIPTPSSSRSGGFFQLCRTVGDQLTQFLDPIECSAATQYCTLHDFIVVGQTLYTLWDRAGESYVDGVDLYEVEQGEITFNSRNWQSSLYPYEAEMTESYLEHQFNYNSSLAGRGFEAVMKTSSFSPLTLRTAISQYAEDHEYDQNPPPQMRWAHANVAEQIAALVGASVHLERDERGAFKYDNYWADLKRDWEGFHARCREIERKGRWPTALGTGEAGEVILLERDRIGIVAPEDRALRAHRQLQQNLPMEQKLGFLKDVWYLHSGLAGGLRAAIEMSAFSILQVTWPSSYDHVISREMSTIGPWDDAFQNADTRLEMATRLISCSKDVCRTILEVVNEVKRDVKQEEDEVELLLPTRSSAWTKAILASYISSSVNARYQICLSLVTTVYFWHEHLSRWDPRSLSELLTTFRGIGMLRHVTRQPWGDPPITQAQADDVVSRMNNMRMSGNGGVAAFSPTYSLLYRLIPETGGALRLPDSANLFLGNVGLFEDDMPEQVSVSDIMFCERLRLLGYTEVARETLAWVPKTPAVAYALGRLWLDMGRYDDAAAFLRSTGGNFGVPGTSDDAEYESLACVLPDAVLFDTISAFYTHVADLFRKVGDGYKEVEFCRLAIALAVEKDNTRDTWDHLITRLIELAEWAEAYAALIQTPYEDVRTGRINILVIKMCEGDAAAMLVTFNTGQYSDEIEEALSYQARVSHPRARPFYSRILHSWYVTKGDYRNAASIMYQRGRRLSEESYPPEEFNAIAEEEWEAYLVAINCLSLVDKKSAWFTMPVAPGRGTAHERRKRRRVASRIPIEEYSPHVREVEIVSLADLRYECALLCARMELARRDPKFVAEGGLAMPPEALILRLTQTNRWTFAMSTARTLNVDMTELFGRLTARCVALSRDPDLTLHDDNADWLLTDQVQSWPGSPADRAWRFLRQALESHDNAETDYKYHKMVLEVLFRYGDAAPPPSWLTNALEEKYPEHYIRTCLSSENYELGLQATLSLVRKAGSALPKGPPKNAMATWLPYTLIDQVVVVCEGVGGEMSELGRRALGELREEVRGHVKRVRALGPGPAGRPAGQKQNQSQAQSRAQAQAQARAKK